MESLQRPPLPHHYAGLDVHKLAEGFDQHGYLLVVADQENGDHPQVCTFIH